LLRVCPCIDVGCLDGYMSQNVSDIYQIYAGIEQVHRF
jgi:hypothetical protein